MRVSLIATLFLICSIFSLLSGSSLAKVNVEEAAKLLPNKIGDAIASSKAAAPRYGISEHKGTASFEVVSAAMRHYVLPSGEKFEIQIFKLPSDSAAYSLLTNRRVAYFEGMSSRFANLTGVGTVAYNSQREVEFIGERDVRVPGKKVLIYEVAFYKGAVVATISGDSTRDTNSGNLVSLAHAFAETLDEGLGEIPVLVKHLPDWETAHGRAVYVVSLPALRESTGNRAVFDAVSFDGGTEAVAATYDHGARLVIVEYTTPQFAFDADAAITARIAGLRGEGKPVPSAYRRVGNYAVFVFDAPNEQVATGLIDKVKYEKDVRWLGEDPYAIGRANRAWLNMSTSVIINTVKVTGIAIAVCLTIGGIFGGAIFMRRRAQAALTENFSDAGGMMRLNLDEMNVESNASRLIGQGDKM